MLLPDPRSHTRKTGDFISEEKKEKKPVRKGIINEKENIPLTNVVTFGTNMIPGILLATVALFVLAAISKLFYGKKDKKQDK